jgi:hypothetical protein
MVWTLAMLACLSECNEGWIKPSRVAVIPVKAGIQQSDRWFDWIPACAGMARLFG